MTLGNRKLFKALLVFLALHSAEEISAFAVVPTIHQKVTIEALSESNFNYLLPNGSLQQFSNESLSRIAQSNADIDIWSLATERFAEDYHFDDERFALGQDLLVKTRNLIILQLNDSAFSKSGPSDLLRQTELSLSSRELLGNALHTLQDYYSHSNWVEQQLLLPGNLKMNLALGVKGKQLEAPTNAVCSDGAPGTGPHTSGDYLATGIFDCAHICSAREKKCAHGNVLSPEPISSVPPLPPLSELMIACPWDWALVEPQCGINKDRGFRDGHAPAYELAKQHTSLFVAEIFNEALSTAGPNKNFVALAICHLMGVPNPISACLTSHTITVQKLNKADGSPTLEGLVESSGNTVTPAINCGLLCEGTAIAGTTVVLTAKDSVIGKFVRWAEGGVCASSTNPECTFMVDSNKTAKAVFVLTHTVTVQKVDQAGSPTLEGLVESSGNTVTPAINCGLLCEGTAIAGTTAVLTAKDEGNWKFVRWPEGGVCAASTNRECSFTVDGNKAAKAEFFNDEFGFEVAESPEPWSLLYPRLRCYHYEGEYQITGYYASFDRCYSDMSAVIRCVGSGCSSSRFKVAISKSILSGTVVEGGAGCDWRQDPFGADPGSAQNYVQGSGWWFALGQGWTGAWPSISAISPLSNGSFIMQNFSWIGGAPPGLECRGNMTAKLELEFNVYDSTTGTYTLVPYVINVP